MSKSAELRGVQHDLSAEHAAHGWKNLVLDGLGAKIVLQVLIDPGTGGECVRMLPILPSAITSG